MKVTDGWWTEAVFYEIYIRSFQDSNRDGIGDLNGITARLDYLADLGVTALWITPFYPSPQVDFGYDVTDYEAVDPQFGTLTDFDRLADAAHRRGMRVVIDVVLNHTSDRHPWFDASRSSRSSPMRDWYVWRDGARDGEPPNNWESVFGGPAWTFDERAGQWYYHCFYRQQPDLNWRNPAVEARMQAVLKFWLDRGVDGFRLDAVNALYEDPHLRDNPPLPSPRVTLTGVVTQTPANNRRPEEVHGALQRVRRFVDAQTRDAVLISEAYLDSPDDLVRYYGLDDSPEVHLPFNFFLAQVPSLDAELFRRAVDEVDAACGGRWPSLVLSNHDINRACDRLAGVADADTCAKLLAILLLTARGTPFIYYGEEIGMRTEPPRHRDEVRDPVGRTFWPVYKGRDGVRRPMSWSPGAGHGFTSVTPWLGFASDAGSRNVAEQTDDGRSVLEFYRALLRLRGGSRALRQGDYTSIDAADGVFAYTRRLEDAMVLVALNMSDRPVETALIVSGGPAVARRVALGTHRRPQEPVDPRRLDLRPFEGVVIV
jgi:alpha-glucosidase